ncbi:amidohydrolase family protein [Paenibacillaceae bacterium WGS1546]|uniref:N-acyl-D-amino-acid deacylase family protein n=1 Tax=Cohnella sp. WGS1546 TaxID=3366810 RepID=UPI00372D41AC
MTFDLIIDGGIVVDGTGESAYLADIGIRGDRIFAIGDLSAAEASRRIDASGKVVAPGFIDVHVHSELALLGGKDRFAPLRMGVTTQLTGPDGFSWAPLEDCGFREMRELLHVFYDDALMEGLDRLDIGGFMNLFQGNLPSNIVLQAPHGSIRTAVVGWEERPATVEELSRMETMTRQWMEAGARSFCTGLEYEPMRRADTQELIRLSKVAAEYGGIYVAHQRGYADKVQVGCEETFRIAREADIPVHISHFTVDGVAEQLVDDALGDGLQVSFDMYAYPAGCTHLLMGLPESLQAGPPDRILESLRDPQIRASMQEHLEDYFPLDRVVFAAAGTRYPSGWEGKSLREVTRELDMSLADAVGHILLETNLQALMIYHWAEERYPFLETTFRHGRHMVSTDGVYVGDKPHPRGFGTYPKVLGQYVRENGWLTLEQAVRKMTAFPASVFNIKQRGTIREGYFADLVVFDAETIDGPATFADPRLAPVGIDAVIVNGKPAIERGIPLPGLYGQIIK